MSTHANRGFTIIEVMLFLAVTGALVIAILAGAGVSIGQQRYRDSVNSLKSFIQTQYNEVTNVINDRGQGWTCDTAATVTQTAEGAGETRGTSNCVILGRFITVNETGTVLTTANVVGYHAIGAPSATSDIAELATNYTMQVSPINQATTEVSWGAQIVNAGSTTPQRFSLLILRSPLSGSIVTFTANGDQAGNVKGMVTTTAMATARDLCVNSDAAFTGQRLGVRIESFATSQSSVMIPTANEGVCA
jgi:type II secretory pathway pseudopilin PulG